MERKRRSSSSASTLRAGKIQPGEKTPSNKSVIDTSFLMMMESSPEATALIDPSGIIQGWNAGAAALTGYSEGEIVGQKFDRLPFLSPEEIHRLAEIFPSYIRGETAVPIWATLLRKDGSRRNIMLHGGIFRNRERIVGLKVIAVDFSDVDRIEETVRRSDAVLRKVFEAAPVGLMLSQRRVTKVANKAVLTMLGYTEEEFLEKDTRFLYRSDEEFYAVGLDLTLQTLEKPVATLETVWLRKDGEPLNVELSVCPNTPGKLHEGYVVTVTDITGRKRIDAELKFRLDLESLILDITTRVINLPPDMIDAGIHRALEDIGRFTGVDRSYVFLFDAPKGIMNNTHEWCAEGIESQRSRMQGKAIADFPNVDRLFREGRDIHLPRIADLAGDTEENRQLARDGTRSLLAVPLFCEGKILGFLGLDAVRAERDWPSDTISLLRIAGEIFAGALERRRAQKELRESERKYRTLIEYGLVGYFIQQDYVIRFCSRTFADIFGYKDPQSLIGHLVWELIAPESKETVSGEVQSRLRGEKEFSHYEFNGLKQDGTPITCEVLGARIEYEGRLALQGAILDISERKRAEKSIENSLREKETLIREIHHRTKNNMQVISSLINLQSRKIGDPRIEDMFKETQQRIKTMALVHERLYQSQDLSRVDFGGYLRILTTHLVHLYGASSDRIKIEIEAAKVALDIQTAIPLGLIANEIISNAMKHAFPDDRTGTIRIRVGREKDETVVLAVRDDGVGIPEGMEIGNTETLGMEIISSLIHQLDARLEIRRDRGSEFLIRFKEPPYKPRMPE